MANIIAVLNPKGGCGKTTLAVHLATALSRQGDPVLLVDADTQGSARDWHEAGDGRAPFPVVGLDRPTLEKDLPGLSAPYRWVILDGAAKLEKIIAAAVKCADLVLIPLQPSPLDLWACAPLVEMIEARRTVTDGVPTAAFVVMRAKKGTRLTREVRAAVADYAIPVLEGTIYDRTEFARSMASGGTVLGSAPDGPAAWEILHLAKQVRGAFDD